MRIYHLRSATLIIESGNDFILVDPMLGDVGSQMYYTFFRFQARKKNPLVPLPKDSEMLLEKVTYCLVSHKHADHIDNAGIQFLKDRNIPVFCSNRDREYFVKQGLNIASALNYWKKEPFIDGFITGIPAKHGYGFIARQMGNVMGFYIELPNEPSVYISSDTAYTDNVEKALKELLPAVTVVACGSAQLDLGKPILMSMEDILKFVKNSPKRVIANHLEALNHCPTTREQLKTELGRNNLLEKVWIPDDGDSIEFV